MTDEDKIQAMVNRGRRAQELLDSVLDEAFRELNDEILELWEASTDRDERDRAWISIRLLRRWRSILARYAKDGRHAERQINNLISTI